MSDSSPQSLRARRLLSFFLPVSIGGLLLFLSVASADSTNGTERGGVTVTKEVPHSEETIQEIRNREMTNPLPSRGDRAIHPHGIPRTRSDNGTCIPPVDDRTVK